MNFLMIHDIREEYFNLELNRYRLTFDDGLFSQYYYFPLFRDHPEKLTYFITTSFIKPGEVRRMYTGSPISYLKTKKYMHRAFIEGKLDHFMNIEEIRIISQQQNVRVGVHSHFHDVIITRQHPRKKKPLSLWKLKRFPKCPEISSHNLSIRSKLAFQGFECRNGALVRRAEIEWEDFIKYDTEQCLKWFAQNLGFAPDHYCFPFNEHNHKLISILKTFGFKRFFAARSGGNKEVNGRVDIDRLIQD